MTVKGALKAKEAGAAAIVVSNHGGRVLDRVRLQQKCSARSKQLSETPRKSLWTEEVNSVRTDVFKALALGADAVIIARPFVTAVYGAEEEGVKASCGKNRCKN